MGWWKLMEINMVVTAAAGWKSLTLKYYKYFNIAAN
jgi:hypothetical protein